MTANHSEGGAGPPDPENEKAALADGSLNETRNSTAKVVASAETVNSEIDRLLRQWLRTGEDFPRRLAHVLRDAARKQQDI